MTRIAFLGLGAMGTRMAASLLAGGFDLTAWNRDPAKTREIAEKGAKMGASPRAAAMGADIVIAMLRDDEASARVWLDPQDGALLAMRPGAIAIESSTLSLRATRNLATAARNYGVAFLDAPVVGSRPQAEARQLIHLVGGEAEILSRAQPALKTIGGSIHHAGPTSAGMALKLAINALFAVQVAASAEILAALERQGVSPARASDIIGATPVASPSAKSAMASMIASAYAPLFPVGLAAKDLGYALDAAQDNATSMRIIQAAQAMFNAAVAQGLGEEHLTAVRKLCG